MSDRDDFEYRMRRLEDRVEYVSGEIHRLHLMLIERLGEIDRNNFREINDAKREITRDVHDLKMELWRNPPRSERIERTDSGGFNSWIMISLFYIIVIVSIMILPMAIRSVPTTPPPQNITIQMPPVEQPKAVEQPTPELRQPSKTIEEQNIVEEAPPVETKSIEQSRASDDFLLGLFDDLPLAVVHAAMCGVIVFLFKIVMQ